MKKLIGVLVCTVLFSFILINCGSVGSSNTLSSSPTAIYVAPLSIDEQFLNAVNQGDLNEVERLLQDGADINYKEPHRQGMSALAVASSQGNSVMALFLVASGADVNLQNNSGETPLHFAVSANNLEIIQFLIENGADIQPQGDSTPLLAAARRGYFEIVQFLVRNGADINRRDNNGNSALDLAYNRGHIQVISYLIDQNAVQFTDRSIDRIPLRVHDVTIIDRNGLPEMGNHLVSRAEMVIMRLQSTGTRTMVIQMNRSGLLVGYGFSASPHPNGGWELTNGSISDSNGNLLPGRSFWGRIEFNSGGSVDGNLAIAIFENVRGENMMDILLFADGL